MGAAHGITSIARLWKPLIKPKLTKQKKKQTPKPTKPILICFTCCFLSESNLVKNNNKKSSILETVSRILLPINS